MTWFHSWLGFHVSFFPDLCELGRVAGFVRRLALMFANAIPTNQMQAHLGWSFFYRQHAKACCLQLMMSSWLLWWKQRYALVQSTHYIPCNFVIDVAQHL